MSPIHVSLHTCGSNIFYSTCRLYSYIFNVLSYTGALKQYLRELPYPLLTFELCSAWTAAAGCVCVCVCVCIRVSVCVCVGLLRKTDTEIKTKRQRETESKERVDAC